MDLSHDDNFWANVRSVGAYLRLHPVPGVIARQGNILDVVSLEEGSRARHWVS